MDRTVSPVWPRGLLTLADWDALPEDECYRRTEVAEGVLVFWPGQTGRHQYGRFRLATFLERQLPEQHNAVPAVEVLLSLEPLTIRVPDIVVAPDSLILSDAERLHAADVLLAVEVLSDGTRRVDRVLKLSEYAEAGIPQYWIVDLGEPVRLLAYVLADGAYELSGEHTGTATLDVAGHTMTIDLDALTRR